MCVSTHISISTPIEEGLLENPRGRRDMQGPKSKKESVRAMQREGGGRGSSSNHSTPVGEVWIFFGATQSKHLLLFQRTG